MFEELKVGKALLPLLKIHPWVLPTTVVLGIISSFFEGAGIGLFIPLLQNLDRTAAQPATGNRLIDFAIGLFAQVPAEGRLTFIVACIFASVALKNAVSYGNSVLLSWFNSRLTHRLRVGIHDQLLHLSYDYLDHSPPGKLMNILATESWRTGQAITNLANLITTSCTILVFTSILMAISWQLTLLVVSLMVLISFSVQTIRKPVEKLGRRATEGNAVLAARMLESLAGMKTIRAYTREAHEKARFDWASQHVRDTFFKLDVLTAVSGPWSEVLSVALLAAIAALAGYFLNGTLALPVLLTFVFMLYRLQPQVRILDANRLALSGLTGVVEEVTGFLGSDDKSYLVSGRVGFEELRQGIRLEEVSFSYGAAEKAALHRISLDIPKGKTTAFVGPSGAGKSTIAKLIPRFYDASVGTIYVDDLPLQSLDLRSWREQISVVSQDVYIFNATVRENILYGRLDASEAEMIHAARQANAHDFICELGEGYDTPLGDRGVRLSGGQRQRIAIARAFIRNPQIIILDEATSALDSLSECLIQEALATLRRNRTVIVIAHRLSTIESADQIVVLDAGRVVERGDLQQLLKLDGLYSRLYRLQYRDAAHPS